MFGFRSILAKMSGYDAANERGHGRRTVPVERVNEDGLLPGRKRSQLVATQRDSFRNTTFSPATALQLQVNVVGVEGGRLMFTTADEDWNMAAARAFRRWAKHANFTDGSSLNEMLQLLLIQLTHNGGDFIAVYDDGCLTGGRGTGRIRIFEADEIKNVVDEEFARIYPANFTQRNGIVYNQYAQIVGAFVSSSARNDDAFKPGEYINLRLRTPATFDDSNWIFVASRWRCNQGRGVSTITHVTNLLQDLADTQGSEVMAAKLNAGLGIVVKDTSDEAATTGTREWGEDDTVADGEAGDVYADGEADEASENAALKQAATNLQAGQAAIVKLRNGKDISSFATERPNLNTVEFIKSQRNEAGTVFGMGPSYTTLEPAGSYTAFRGEMVMAYRAFQRLQKKLERDFLDWVAIRFVSWNFDNAPDGYEDDLLWRWPSMAEVDEGAAQTAIEKALANGVESLTSLLGPEKVEKIVEQQKAEKDLFEAAGLVYPASRTENGSIVGQNAGETKGSEE